MTFYLDSDNCLIRTSMISLSGNDDFLKGLGEQGLEDI